MLIYRLLFCDLPQFFRSMKKSNKSQQVNDFAGSKIYIDDVMLDTSLKLLEWLYNTS